MSKVTFGSKWGRVRKLKSNSGLQATRSAEEVVRDIKKEDQKPSGEDYRGKALGLFGLICARCGREFDEKNRHLLTIHHIDGNHDNNPRDGSNWVNLCVYCHEDIHSRGILGEYLAGVASQREWDVVYGGEKSGGLGSLAEKLEKALQDKEKQKT